MNLLLKMVGGTIGTAPIWLFLASLGCSALTKRAPADFILPWFVAPVGRFSHWIPLIGGDNLTSTLIFIWVIAGLLIMLEVADRLYDGSWD